MHSFDKFRAGFVNPVNIFRLIQFLLGAVFVYDGVTKMPDPLRFADSIVSFKLLPMILINPLALALPPLEVFTGIILVAVIARSRHRDQVIAATTRIGRVGALSVIILCSIFCLALLSALLRGIQMDCGCFGGGKPSALKTWLAFGRDNVFLAIAAAIYYRNREATE